MCRPPDLTPESALDGFEGDAYGVEEGYEWDEAQDDASMSAAASALLGKRSLLEEALAQAAINRAAKVPRAGADSSAASVILRFEQQQHQQQQQLLLAAAAASAAAAATAEPQDSLPRAIAEQQLQIQQLQLLKHLRQEQAHAQVQAQAQAQAALVGAAQILPEQQQLLLAQQQLLQQSQAKQLLTNPLASANAAADAGPLASLMRQSAAPSASMASLLRRSRLPSEQKLQAWPPLTPLAQSASAAAAAAAAALAADPAAMFGLASTPFCSTAQELDDEKKAKRMQSNRASAKRSRQRRQQRLEELDKSSAVLIGENTSLRSKLDEAQQEIQDLKEKNTKLTGEVAHLRKMLGLESNGQGLCSKAESEGVNSAAGLPQSCVEWDSCVQGTDKSTSQEVVVVKAEAASEEAPLVVGDSGITSVNANLAWLDDALPLSPSASSGLLDQDGALDQLLGGGDVLSELLACV